MNGDDSIFYLHDGTAWRPCAHLTNNSLEGVLEMKERINKTVPGVKQKSPGALDYTVNLDGEYVDTTSVGGETAKASHDFMHTKQAAKTRIPWKLTNGTVAAEYGYGYISNLRKDAPAGEDMTFTATIAVDGGIENEDPTV